MTAAAFTFLALRNLYLHIKVRGLREGMYHHAQFIDRIETWIRKFREGGCRPDVLPPAARGRTPPEVNRLFAASG
jgi:hypothetical protein